MEARTVIVTGAARGLGQAMALALVEAGHRVIAVDRDAPAAQASNQFSPLQFRSLAVDLTSATAVDDIVVFSERAFGPVDALVNCAGIGQETISPTFVTEPVKFWSVDDTHWERIFAVNLQAAFRLCRALAPGMVARGWGRIVNVTTSLETMLRVGMSPYGPSKAALEALSAVMAKDLEGTGVTSNVLVPGGPADTRMMPGVPEAQRVHLVQPEMMRAPIVWLLSSQSDGTSGRRFRASAWPTDKPGDEAAEIAGAPVAWHGLAGGAAKVQGRN